MFQASRGEDSRSTGLDLARLQRKQPMKNIRRVIREKKRVGSQFPKIEVTRILLWFDERERSRRSKEKCDAGHCWDSPVKDLKGSRKASRRRDLDVEACSQKL